MKKAVLVISLLFSVAGVTFAGTVGTPEIDPSTGVSALALLGGAFVVVMARRKR